MLSLILITLLSSSDYRTRDWTTRYTPWIVMVALVPNNHPDPEVRLRWRKSVPQWYKELNPVFLRVLVHGNDFKDAWTRWLFLSAAYRYTDYSMDYYTGDPGWCHYVLTSIRERAK